MAVGINDEEPFTFATSPPYLQFIWSLSNPSIASIQNFHKMVK